MSTMNTDQGRVLDTGDSQTVWTVAFHPDGKHLLGGNDDGFRRWRLADHREVGRQTGMDMFAICVSRNRRWIVCATGTGASVWDGEMHEKVIDVEVRKTVYAVDVSADSTRFATGTNEGASIWSITTGQRLVGPFKHDSRIMGIQFSPSGEHIAIACTRKSIDIFDSRRGDKLVTVEINISNIVSTPLAWSSDGQQIFAASSDNKIKAFDVSTGSQLLQSETLSEGNEDVRSIALAANGKVIATYAMHSISFLDTLTLARIGSVVEDSRQIWSIAISADSSYLATGQEGGNIGIRHLSKLLPDSYGPFHAPTGEEAQKDEQPSTSSGRESEVPDSNPVQEHPGKSSPPESGGHSEDANRDLLEHEAPSSIPALQSFDYDESLSSALSSSREDEAPPVGPPHAISQSDALPIPSSSETCPEGNLDTVEPPEGHSIFKRWRQRVGNNAPASHKPDRRSGKSREPADRRSPTPAPARVEDRQEEPSRMAAARNKIIKLPTSRNRSRSKSVGPNKDYSRSAGHGTADTREADPGQQATDPSQPSATGAQVMNQEISGYTTLRFSINVPTRLLCFRSGAHDAQVDPGD